MAVVYVFSGSQILAFIRITQKSFQKSRGLRPILLLQAWSSLDFVSSPSDANHTRVLEPLGYIILSAYHLQHWPVNPQIIRGTFW